MHISGATKHENLDYEVVLQWSADPVQKVTKISVLTHLVKVFNGVGRDREAIKKSQIQRCAMISAVQ